MESLSNPIMSKLYGQQGGEQSQMGGMPSGFDPSQMGGMPSGPNVEEVD